MKKIPYTYNLKKEREIAKSIFKAANVDTQFFTVVWIAIMLMSLSINNQELLLFSKKVTTIGFTGIFIYLSYLVLNLIKYSVFKMVLEKITKKNIATAIESSTVRNMFMLMTLLSQILIYILFFTFNGFESFKVISGSESNWLLMSMGFISGIVAGIFKLILGIKYSLGNTELTQDELGVIEGAIRANKNRTDYFI